MRKRLITAATVAMSAALAGLAFAAAPDGSPTTDTSVVSPEVTPSTTPEVTPSTTPEVTPSTTPQVTPSTTPDAPDDSDGRVGGGQGSDDVNDAPDDSDGRVRVSDDSSGRGGDDD